MGPASERSGRNVCVWPKADATVSERRGSFWVKSGHPHLEASYSVAEGVTAYPSKGGHKPWTLEQCTAAETHLTGMIRRAYFLARYTGQRSSDVVKLGETFIDDGGFRIRQIKTGDKIGDIWCPIEDQLAAEIATWERAPGPCLRQNHGKVYSKQLLHDHFLKARETIPALAGTTFHGLRATRVVELRHRGATTLQIQDQVGMSPRHDRALLPLCRPEGEWKGRRARACGTAQEQRAL